MRTLILSPLFIAAAAAVSGCGQNVVSNDKHRVMNAIETAEQSIEEASMVYVGCHVRRSYEEQGTTSSICTSSGMAEKMEAFEIGRRISELDHDDEQAREELAQCREEVLELSARYDDDALVEACPSATSFSYALEAIDEDDMRRIEGAEQLIDTVLDCRRDFAERLYKGNIGLHDDKARYTNAELGLIACRSVNILGQNVHYRGDIDYFFAGYRYQNLSR